MGRFIDTDPTPDEYLYHRQLVRLTAEQAAIPASQMTVRVAASTGAVDTFKVTEWLGTTLPPHVAGYQKGFFNRYQDPTENRAQLDALAAEFPNLVTPVNLPNLTNGYQRKSQAIMSGTSAIGSTPPVTLGALLINTTGEITAAQPVASIPFTGTAGQTHPRDRGRHPGRLDRLHPDDQGPRRHRPAVDRHGHEPGVRSTGRCTTAGTYTFEISGFQGDLGDFTFKVQPVSAAAHRPRGRAHRQGVGPPRRRRGHRRVQEPGRRQRRR